MNNLIDKFFKDKLEGYAIEPEAAAWSRIASNRPKKNKSVIWFRAAAMLLATVLGLLLWLYSNNNTSINETVAKSNQQPSIKEGVVVTNDPLENSEEKEKESGISPIRKGKTKVLLAVEKESEEPVSSIVNEILVKNLTDESITKFAINDSIQIHDESLLQEKLQPTEMKRPIVIVYELKEVTKKPDSSLVADLSPQRKTGFKKVLEIANDVRTGESPLGGLRQAKEEIFAFNFKKEDKNNK